MEEMKEMLFGKQVSYRFIHIQFLIESIFKSPVLQLCIAEIYHHPNFDSCRFQIIQKLGEMLLDEIFNGFKFNKNYTFDDEIGNKIADDNIPESYF